jgi:ABC-type branched-subunit amino acid transport system substrate-binding protein
MKRFVRRLVPLAFALFFLAPVALAQPAANAGFDFKTMSDMSDFDPANPVIPTGDTIKIAVVASFSGPAALVGQIYWTSAAWAVHDVNKRGGIMVDGKKKLIELIKADHASKPDQAKRITERMVLQDKVNVLWGTDGSNLQKIINETANKYKVIAINTASLSDDLQDATNFSRYAFQTSMSADQLGRGLAYYYGQTRKKEKKFYILCQDYSFGHVLAEGFKKGIKEFYPDAQIVGEDYHKLFLTDFAPYLEKIKASGAEVVFTGDWIPDAANLLKQARQAGSASLRPCLPRRAQLPARGRRRRHQGADPDQPVRHGQPVVQDAGTDQVLQDLERSLENQVEDRALQQPSLRARHGKHRLVHRADVLVAERHRAGAEHGPREDHQGLGRRQLPVHHRQGHQDARLRPQGRPGPARLRVRPADQQKQAFNIRPTTGTPEPRRPGR